jgi:hypothetical protein
LKGLKPRVRKRRRRFGKPLKKRRVKHAGTISTEETS